MIVLAIVVALRPLL